MAKYKKIKDGYTFIYSDKEMTKLHNGGEPAVIHDDGRKFYYIDGIFYTNIEASAIRNFCRGRKIEL